MTPLTLMVWATLVGSQVKSSSHPQNHKDIQGASVIRSMQDLTNNILLSQLNSKHKKTHSFEWVF